MPYFLMLTTVRTKDLIVGEQNGVRGGGSVPPNQWIKEMEVWYASGLAAMQNSILDWVVKPWPQGHPETMYSTVSLDNLGSNYTTRKLSSQKDNMCQNQLIRSTAAVQNFSLLGLSFVVATSLAIILTDLLLSPCVDFIRRRRRVGNSNMDLSPAAEAGRVARIADDKYNLLAMALQNAGLGDWEKGSSGIPVTRGQVSVCAPVEMKGLAAYPCMTCSLCKLQSTTSELKEEKQSDSSSDLHSTTTLSEKKQPQSHEKEILEKEEEAVPEKIQDIEFTKGLKRHETCQTLVGVPEDE
jgi:hypothetical protein